MSQFPILMMKLLFAVCIFVSGTSAAIAQDLAAAASKSGPPRLPSFGQTAAPHPAPLPKRKKIVVAPAPTSTAEDANAVVTELRVYRGNGEIPKEAAQPVAKEGEKHANLAPAAATKEQVDKGKSQKDNKESQGKDKSK
jgi:hypothetical protein